MRVTSGLKDSLRTSLHHVSQFPDLSQRFDIFKQELVTLGERLSSYGSSAPRNTKLFRDIWALRDTILGHRRAMKTIIIEMNSVYHRINKSGYAAVTQPILTMHNGELLQSRTPELEGLMLVTGFDAQWRRVNGMWNEAMGFSEEVGYLGNCCA